MLYNEMVRKFEMIKKIEEEKNVAEINAIRKMAQDYGYSMAVAYIERSVGILRIFEQFVRDDLDNADCIDVRNMLNTMRGCNHLFDQNDLETKFLAEKFKKDGLDQLYIHSGVALAFNDPAIKSNVVEFNAAPFKYAKLVEQVENRLYELTC